MTIGLNKSQSCLEMKERSSLSRSVGIEREGSSAIDERFVLFLLLFLFLVLLALSLSLSLGTKKGHIETISFLFRFAELI